MNVRELKDKLANYPDEHEVLLLDLSNDGDGDGLAPLLKVEQVSIDLAMINDKPTDAVLITINS